VMDVTKAEVGAADRRQSRRQPSGRGDVDQERRQERHEADPRRSAALRARAPRDPLSAVQAGHRRRDAQRDHARHRRGGARSRRASSTTGRAATRRSRTTSQATARKRWRRFAASRRDAARSGAALRQLQGLDDPLGEWESRSTCTAPTTRGA
jgi:hypothetical protein